MANDLDSDQANGTPATPIAGGSQGEGDSGGSFNAQKLQTMFEALTTKLDEVDKRSKALQGDKDRGITSTKKEVDELKRKFAEIDKLKKSGMADDDAFEELSFRDDVRNLRTEISKLNPAQPQSPGKAESAAVDLAKVISDYQLDGNDPEVIAEVLSKTFASPLEAENAALKLAYRRDHPTLPSIAAASTFTGSPPKPDTLASLQAEYEKKVKPLRGNVYAVSQLQAEFRKKGLNL